MEKLHGKVVADKARKTAEQLFDNLVGVTAHEMRGFLTPLKAGTSCLLHHLDNGAVDPVECRQILVKVINRVAFLERLLDDMRSYSQALPLERRRERLSDLVDNAIAMVRENLGASSRSPNGISVQVAVPANITLDVSRHQILVAIGNVVKNAVEAFADGSKHFRDGTIHVSAQVIDEEIVELVIDDTGMGIAKEDLGDIRQFIPGRTTKKNQGTGFGLPIAKRNIRSHGGSIGIDSRENEGTRVTIILPLEQQGDSTYDVQGTRG